MGQGEQVLQYAMELFDLVDITPADQTEQVVEQHSKVPAVFPEGAMLAQERFSRTWSLQETLAPASSYAAIQRSSATDVRMSINF